MKTVVKTSYPLVSCFLLLVAHPVLAATISFTPAAPQATIEQPFEVKVLLDSQGESVNTFAGKILFPSDVLALKEIRDGNSLVNFWIQRPHEEQGARDKRQGTGDKGQGMITFSGITPGGFTGTSGLLFSLIFQGTQSGEGDFSFRDAQILKNDGLGTQADITDFSAHFSISAQAISQAPVSALHDTDPPETFVPEISRDTSVFQDQWFIAFATQDKLSGMDNYEILETRSKIQGTWGWKICSLFLVSCPLSPGWVVAESPYVLQDQELKSYIFVKAADKAGNTRVVELSPRNPAPWYQDYGIYGIILLGILGIALGARIVKRQGAGDKRQGIGTRSRRQETRNRNKEQETWNKKIIQLHIGN